MFFGGFESLYFCELGAHAKFRNPKQYDDIEKERKINTKNKLLRWPQVLRSDIEYQLPIWDPKGIHQ